jgi:predicted  nucleic acid-binding Zn-ribbon protein
MLLSLRELKTINDTLNDENTLIKSKIESLKEEKQTVEIENSNKITELKIKNEGLENKNKDFNEKLKNIEEYKEELNKKTLENIKKEG